MQTQKNTIIYRVFLWFLSKINLTSLLYPKIKSIYKLTYILMKNNTGINTKIKHFSKIFIDKRTYEVFKSIIIWILCLKDWKQWDVANVWWKTLSQIQYFFYKSNWSYSLLNRLRIDWIRNKVWWCRDKKWDILILDGTIISK